MTYPEAVAYLDCLAQHGWKLDLGRIRRLCELAGHPERAFPAVLVGGSAGKGSTCAFLASILREAGLRVGTAPKPHLFTHRERAQVDGVPIAEERFAALMERIRPLAEQVTEEQGSPTVFEVMTLLAFLHFAEERVDRAVVEVGLGGRFDATNVLEPDVAIITMVGLDHTDRLGDTVEKIAFEKAGIIRPGQHVITGAQGAALQVIEQVARERGVARLWRLGHEIDVVVHEVSAAGTTFSVGVPGGSFVSRRIRLVGEHQARNAALALAACAGPLAVKHPSIGPRALDAGLQRASLPGRLQTVRDRPQLLVDAAHSPDRAEALVRALRDVYLPPGRRMLLVIGCSQGHEPETVVAHLAPLASLAIATRSGHPAAVPADAVAAAARACGVPAIEVEPTEAAVRLALERAGPDDLVLVTGSFFVVAEALRALRPEEDGAHAETKPA